MTTKECEKNAAKPSLGREELLEMVRAEVKKAGGKRLTFNEFVVRSGLSPNDIQRHFARWTDVLKATGLRLGREELPIPTERLLEDWGSVARELGRVPTPADYKVRGVFSLPTLAGRLGRWADIREAFLAYARKNEGWKDVIGKVKESGNQESRKKRKVGSGLLVSGSGLERGEAKLRGRGRSPVKLENERFRFWRSRQRVGGLPPYGERLGFEALEHAPVNEQGVVFLFGMLAGRMGYVVDGLRPGFPDCEARRQVDATRWERVRIEFEFESRNFLDHGHAKEGCDLIVCWKDNWPGCPVETVALSDVVAGMRAGQ